MLHYCPRCEFIFESKIDKPECRQCSGATQTVEDREDVPSKPLRPTGRFEPYASDEPTARAPARKKTPEEP